MKAGSPLWATSDFEVPMLPGLLWKRACHDPSTVALSKPTGPSYKCVALLAPTGSITINNNCLHCSFSGSSTVRLQTPDLSRITSAHSSEAPCVGRAPAGRGLARRARCPGLASPCPHSILCPLLPKHRQWCQPPAPCCFSAKAGSGNKWSREIELSIDTHRGGAVRF